jgi:para-nitrobenzyl esterase
MSKAVLCFFLALASWACAQSPRVTIDSGTLVGFSDGKIDSFKGIPYAKPPVGPLRWRPPQPTDKWTGDRAATDFGAACPQQNPQEEANGKSPETSEDCLALNVWTPSHREHLLPVLVWIHGGGNTQGASSHRYYDGGAFARDGVVLVSINYRLGLLGFFAHPALTREAKSNDPLGNYGLMDQVAALEWVKRNIKAFGGDPSKVTIFGESAGGQDVLCLMAAPSANGLFASVISESPGLIMMAPSLADAESFGSSTATKLGLPGVNATAEQLRKLPANEIVKYDFIDGGPIVDGRFLPMSPKDAFAQHKAIRVPLMIGTNGNEGSLADPEEASKWVFDGFSTEERKKAHELYNTGVDEAWLDRQLFRDLIFAAPVRWIARQLSTTQPVFLYRFSYVRQRQVGKIPGAPHGSEIPYVFDNWWQSPMGGAFLTDRDREEAHLLHACWVSFAIDGAPHCPDAPAWPVYDAKQDPWMEFGEETAVRDHFQQATLDLVEPHAVKAAAPPK